MVYHGRSHHRGNGGSCLLTSEQLIFPIKAHRAWSHPPIKMKRRLPAVSCSKVGASSSNKSSQPPSLECGRIQKKTSVAVSYSRKKICSCVPFSLLCLFHGNRHVQKTDLLMTRCLPNRLGLSGARNSKIICVSKHFTKWEGITETSFK